MVAKSRTPKVDKDRRARIIDVAVQMFSEQDYEDVAIDELCRRADVAKGLVFYYFGDKRGLFASALEQVWDELAAKVAPLPGEESAISRLHGFLRRHLEYVEEHPQRFLVLMGNGYSSPGVADIVTAARQRAVSGVTAGLGCPANPPPRLRQAVHGWSQFVDNVARDWAANRDVSIDEMIDICAQVLVAAVRSANGLPLDHEKELEALRQVVNLPMSERSRAATPKRTTRAKRPPRSEKSALAATGP